jgi:hypothetical protein
MGIRQTTRRLVAHSSAHQAFISVHDEGASVWIDPFNALAQAISTASTAASIASRVTGTARANNQAQGNAVHHVIAKVVQATSSKPVRVSQAIM